MHDNDLKEALKKLYAHDSEGLAGVTDPRLLAQCRAEINDRLFAGGLNFRTWFSRLVRDMYLSDDALRQGSSIEELCEFWAWFDDHMWTSDVAKVPVATSG
jgi:hypothetical protein